MVGGVTGGAGSVGVVFAGGGWGGCVVGCDSLRSATSPFFTSSSSVSSTIPNAAAVPRSRTPSAARVAGSTQPRFRSPGPAEIRAPQTMHISWPGSAEAPHCGHAARGPAGAAVATS